MKLSESKYTDDDAICVRCIEDHSLREIVKTEGSNGRCSLCGEKDISVTIKQLAEIIDPYLREQFQHGHYERRYGPGDDDSYSEEQQGDDLSYVLQELMGQYLDCEDALIKALMDGEVVDPRSGEQGFYDRMVNYEQTPVYTGDLYEEWRSIGEELKNRRRFFSDRAREFFDWLFEELEVLRLYEEPGEKQPTTSAKSERQTVGVIREWGVGTAVFRGRRADSAEDYTRILSSPRIELAPPPARHALTGRMNPEGVTIFYGALEDSTCLAEMRSSIGGHIVVGRFETTRVVRILDFRRLDKAYWGDKGLSYFQADFDRQVARRKFLRGLHRMISQPVVPGHESDYLITQVLAEYLAHVRKANVDGLLFASSQLEDGTNLVLFDKGASDDLLGRFSLRFVDDSARLYRTRKIEYDIHPVEFFFLKDGSVHVGQEFEYGD